MAKGSSRYCKHCKKYTPVMYCEGGQYCMYCQKEYEDKKEK